LIWHMDSCISGMKFRMAIPEQARFHRCGWFPFFFHKSGRGLALCLMTGLLPAILTSAVVAQTSTNIPLFQFAVFYNMNLEIDPGSTMAIKGAVWSNGGIWSGTGNVTYQKSVSAVGTVHYYPTTADPWCTGKSDVGTPLANFTYTPSSGNNRITMPVGTNNDPATVEAIINLPPTNYALNTAATFSTNGQVYLANAADLYVTNCPTGTNFGTSTPASTSQVRTNMLLYYQDPNTNSDQVAVTGYQTLVPFDFYIITNRTSKTTFTTNAVVPASCTATNVVYAGYSFLTNVTFVDWREGFNSGSPKTVQAVQIDVARFNAWLANTNYSGGTNVNGGKYFNARCRLSNHKSHPIDSIYIYNAVPLTRTTLPAVRVANGAMLPPNAAPYGLTVATAQPMYVWGNYNVNTLSGSSVSQNSTTYTWPAGLMADAVTILSENWSDSVTTLLPTPTTTTVNAAILEGIVQSTNGIYSGGFENSLRLLENWSSIPLYYNGSIAVMFPSQYATNCCKEASYYYSLPKRNWAFNTNYTDITKLPPLTPLVSNITYPPTIITQPTNQTVVLGGTAAFAVTASGSGLLAYQWSFGGTNLGGATNASLTLTDVQSNQAGNYAVLVTNAYGSAMSSNAVLTVLIPPGIQTSPTNQTVFVGDAATFNVIATGSLPLNYQWSFNGTNLDGTTNAWLTLGNVNTNNAGDYLVVVTNLCGGATSSVATLTVTYPPSITIPLTNQAVLVGSNVILSVTVAGTGPFTYEWYVNGVHYPYPIVAGNGVEGYSGDDGPATNAMLDKPSGLAVNKLGELYIADYLNNRIRKVDAAGIITTVAGNGDASFSGDGGAATNARLYYPYSVTVNAAGSLYIADFYNNRIRKVDTNGIIATVAGNGGQGFSGDGGPATNATFLGVTGVAVDTAGNLYINDWYNNRIRKVDTNGTITTIAGNGTAGFSGDGGVATNASLNRPEGVTVDAMGNLYIADRDNNRVRKVDADGMITTVAGNGTPGFSGNYGAATNASLACPNSVAVDPVGNLYIAGYTNYCIHKVDTNGVISSIPVAVHALCFIAVNAAGNLYVDDTMVYQTRLKAFMGPVLTLTNVDLSDAGSYFVVITSPYGSVISSNAVLSVYTTAAATLSEFSFATNNGFQFQVAGVPGFNYAVQESTNLIDWLSLLTNTSPFSFTDTNAAGFPQQFYRAVYLP